MAGPSGTAEQKQSTCASAHGMQVRWKASFLRESWLEPRFGHGAKMQHARAACYVHAHDELTSWIVHEHDTCTIHAFKHAMRARHDHALGRAQESMPEFRFRLDNQIYS